MQYNSVSEFQPFLLYHLFFEYPILLYQVVFYDFSSYKVIFILHEVKR